MKSDTGINNRNLDQTRARLIRGGSYRDLSTVMLMVTRGMIPARVVQGMLGLATPMNQKFTRIFVENCEVADGYNQGIGMILDNPELSKWKYLLCLEEDNVPQPDALLRLYEGITKYDVVGALYFVKGEYGAAMIYGDPKSMPKTYIPQLPIPDTLQECCGVGMGCTLFRMEVFKKMPRPWFRTLQQFVPGQGMQAATQDLDWCGKASTHGYRFAVDTRIKCGHWDQANQIMW